MRQATGFISDAGNHFDTEFDALADDLRHKIGEAVGGNGPIGRQVTDMIVGDLAMFAGMLGHMSSLAPPAVAEATHAVTDTDTGLPMPAAKAIEDSFAKFDSLGRLDPIDKAKLDGSGFSVAELTAMGLYDA